MNSNNNPNMTPDQMQPQAQPAMQPTPSAAPAQPAAAPNPAATPNPAAAPNPAANPAVHTVNNVNPVHTQGTPNGAPTPVKRPMPPKIKKSYNPQVLVGEAFKNLWRDGIMSLASILVLASCLVVLGCFALLVLNINVNMDKLASLNEIVAFTEFDMSEEDALALAEDIKKLDNVENVEFVSKSQGLEDLRADYPEFSDLFDDFEEDGDKPEESTPPQVTDTAAPAETSAPEETQGEAAAESTAAQDSTAVSDTSEHTDTDAPAGTEAPEETAPAAPAETEKPASSSNNKNPLAHSFRIKYIDNAKVATLEFNLNEMEGIRKVSNRQDLAMSLENLKDGISMIFIWFLIVLFVVSVFIIINTIKLAVNSHMEEIRVMKYIGASNWFVVIPYIIEGTIIGIFSGTIAFLVEWGIYFKLGSIISADTPIIELISFDSIRLPVALAFLGLGILTGIIGSCISLKRNLNA